MPHMDKNGDIERQVHDEVRAEHAINIAKVDSDTFGDNADGEEVEGSFKGTIYKDDDGNAFIYLSEINGTETEELDSEGDEEIDREVDRMEGPPENAGHALDIFIIKANRKKKNANSGY